MKQTANKRTKAQKEADKHLIAAEMIRGRTQHQITARLNATRPYRLSRSQISFDVAAIREEWRKHTLVAVSEVMARELAGLEEQHRELWEAWEHSKQDKVRVTKETGAGGSAGGKETVVREGQYGDVSIQLALLQVFDKKARLLGLYAPEHRILSGPDGQPVGGGVVIVIPDNGRDKPAG